MPHLRNIPLLLAILCCGIGSFFETSLLAYALTMLAPCLAARYMTLPALRVWLTFTIAWLAISAATLAHIGTAPTSPWFLVSNERLAMALILSGAFAVVSLAASGWDILAARQALRLRAHQ